MEAWLESVLIFTGGFAWFYFVCLKVLPCLYWIYAYWCRKEKNLRAYGEWAVVTGATDGIGKCYAGEFAARGINVLLISRSEAKCQAVEKELQEQYPKVKFSHLAIDFGNFDAKARGMVQTKVEGLDVGLLINNVGKGALPQFFHETPEEDVVGQQEVNLNSMLWMTQIILGDAKQGMVARKRGAIVNIGSMAGRRTGPLCGMYGAAKAYTFMFSKSMYAEMAEHNIHVSVQQPGRVVSNMTSAFAVESLTFPTAANWVKGAIKFIGHDSDVCGYWPHAVQGWLESQVWQYKWDEKWLDMHQAIRQQWIDAHVEQQTKAAAGGEGLEMPLVSLKGATASVAVMDEHR